MADIGKKGGITGFKASKFVRARLQAALYNAKENRLSKLAVSTGSTYIASGYVASGYVN